LVSGTNTLPKGSPQTKLQEIDFSGVVAEICGLPKPHDSGTPPLASALRKAKGGQHKINFSDSPTYN
jgi:hypothetical protein